MQRWKISIKRECARVMENGAIVMSEIEMSLVAEM